MATICASPTPEHAAAVLVNRLLKAGIHLNMISPHGPGDATVQVPAAVQTQGQTWAAATRGYDVANKTISAPADFGTALRMPRIAVYQSWTANIDEGWTRLILDQYEFPYSTLHNADIIAGRLHARFDAIVLPDQSAKGILEGQTGASVPVEYRGGLGDKGWQALKDLKPWIGADSDFLWRRLQSAGGQVAAAPKGAQTRHSSGSARWTRHHSEPASGYGQPAGVGHGVLHLRLLPELSVFRRPGRLRLAKGTGGGALPERLRRRLRLSQGRRIHGRAERRWFPSTSAWAKWCCSASVRSIAPRPTRPFRCSSTRCIGRRRGTFRRRTWRRNSRRISRPQSAHHNWPREFPDSRHAIFMSKTSYWRFQIIWCLCYTVFGATINLPLP